MEELINRIQEKTGISAEQATSAFNTMKEFIQEKLPSNLGINLDDILNGNFDLSALMSGFFGNKSDDSDDNNPLDKLKNMFS